MANVLGRGLDLKFNTVHRRKSARRKENVCHQLLQRVLSDQLKVGIEILRQILLSRLLMTKCCGFLEDLVYISFGSRRAQTFNLSSFSHSSRTNKHSTLPSINPILNPNILNIHFTPCLHLHLNGDNAFQLA